MTQLTITMNLKHLLLHRSWTGTYYYFDFNPTTHLQHLKKQGFGLLKLYQSYMKLILLRITVMQSLQPPFFKHNFAFISTLPRASKKPVAKIVDTQKRYNCFRQIGKFCSPLAIFLVKNHKN